jgi:AcrR family transcriptional regulator
VPADETRPRTRRERLRVETTQEIKSIALQQLTTHGAGGISLRGIAGEMGMTARAIYTYFPTRNDLITALIDDINTALADTLDEPRDNRRRNSGSRLVAWGVALREWALTHPAEFRLIYGDPIPGYLPPADGPGARAAQRICGALNRLVAEEVSPVHPALSAAAKWSQFPPDYVAKVRAEVPDLSPAVAALALRVWGRIHGLITLEVYGHLQAVHNDPAAIQRADLSDLVEGLRAP